MNSVPYALLYVASAFTAATLAYYSWKRHYLEAHVLAALMVALAFWSLCHAISVASSTLEGALFWAQLQYGGIVLTSPLWLMFSLAYSKRWNEVTPVRLGTLVVLSGLAFAAVLTNQWHHLWWATVSRNANLPFVALDVRRGPLFWLFTAYSYTCVLIGIVLFVRTLVEAPAIYQHQARLVVIGALIPLIGNIVHLSKIISVPVDDPTPFLFVASCVLFWYASLRYKLLNLESIAQREIFENIPDGMVVLNLGNVVVALNNTASQLLNLAQHNSVGQELPNLLDSSPLHGEVSALLATPETSQTRSATYTHNGELQGVEIRTRPLLTRAGVQTGYMLVLRDTSERVRAQQALDQRVRELTLLNQIARATNAAIQTEDLLRVMTSEIVQQLDWERITIGLLRPHGATFEIVIDETPRGMSSLEGRSTHTTHVQALLALLEQGQTRVLHADAQPFADARVAEFVQQSEQQTIIVVPLRNQEEVLGGMFIGSRLRRDVAPETLRLFETIGKLVSDAVVRTSLYDAVQQTNQLKSIFLATVSHELRTPLTSIIGFADMLNQGMFGPIGSEAHEPLDHIRVGGQTLLRLINDILDLSRMEAGHFAIDCYPVDAHAVIQAVATSLQPQIYERKLKLELTLDAVPLVFANSARLRQILVNLVANAIKFTDQGVIRVDTVLHNNMVRISVTDSGIGIASEHLHDVFQAFRQIDSPYTRRYGGSGLGLAISRGLAEQMGGQLSVESTVNRGSTFHCDLPPADDTASRNQFRVISALDARFSSG